MSPVSAPPSKLMLAPPATSVKLPVMFGPNITGRLGLGRSAATIIETTGVFQRAYLDGTTIPPTSDGPGDLKLTFSAANASSIYSGTTVQPRALASLVLIKF